MSSNTPERDSVNVNVHVLLSCNIAPEIISLHYSPPMNIKGQKTPPPTYSAWALNRLRGALSLPLDTRLGWDANVIVKWLVKLDWRMLGQEVQSTNYHRGRDNLSFDHYAMPQNYGGFGKL